MEGGEVKKGWGGVRPGGRAGNPRALHASKRDKKGERRKRRGEDRERAHDKVSGTKKEKKENMKGRRELGNKKETIESLAEDG